MSKTFKFAGVSKRAGAFKARFANDQMRVKVLAKTGSSDIDLIELKEPMTKEDIVAYLLSIDFDNGNAEIRTALEQELDKRTVTTGANKERKGNKETKKPKKAPAKAITLEGIKAKAKVAAPAVSEDAPF